MPGCPYWLFATCLAGGIACAEPLYRWVDPQGNTHYSDHAPGEDAKTLKPDTGPEPTAQEIEEKKTRKLEKELDEIKKRLDQDKDVSETPFVIVPVPGVQSIPEVYTAPYWGPVYPYHQRPPVYPHRRPDGAYGTKPRAVPRAYGHPKGVARPPSKPQRPKTAHDRVRSQDD
jgi:hypothetical protein